MTFTVAHRINPAALAYRATHPSGARHGSARAVTRRAIDRLRSRLELTPQERAVLHVARSPVAVLGGSTR